MLRAYSIVPPGRSTWRRRRWWRWWGFAPAFTASAGATPVETATLGSLLLLDVGFDKFRVLLNLIFCDTHFQKFVK